MSLYLNADPSKITNRAQRVQFQENQDKREASLPFFMEFIDKTTQGDIYANGALTPDDSYREVDSETKVIMNPIGEFATYFKVNAVSKSVSIGTLDYVYRQSSAQVGGTISMSGQVGVIADAGEYKNAGTVIPIIDHGVNRMWREMVTSRNDGYNVMIDDTREAELVVLRTANDWLWNGKATIKSPDGRTWLGINGDPSIAQETVLVDLAADTTTGQEIVDEIRRLRDILRIDNNCAQSVDLGISQETLSKWESLPYSINDKAWGTVLSYIEGLKGINSVYEEPKLETGYDIFMAYYSQEGFHAVTGQAVSTYMMERTTHAAPFCMVKWMAQGFLARNSFTGQKCALRGKQAA